MPETSVSFVTMPSPYPESTNLREHYLTFSYDMYPSLLERSKLMCVSYIPCDTFYIPCPSYQSGLTMYPLRFCNRPFSFFMTTLWLYALVATAHSLRPSFSPSTSR